MKGLQSIIHTYIGSSPHATILSPALMHSAGIFNSGTKGLNAIQTACDLSFRLPAFPSSLAASYVHT